MILLTNRLESSLLSLARLRILLQTRGRCSGLGIRADKKWRQKLTKIVFLKTPLPLLFASSGKPVWIDEGLRKFINDPHSYIFYVVQLIFIWWFQSRSKSNRPFAVQCFNRGLPCLTWLWCFVRIVLDKAVSYLTFRLIFDIKITISESTCRLHHLLQLGTSYLGSKHWIDQLASPTCNSCLAKRSSRNCLEF